MNNLEKINLLHYCNSIESLLEADYNLIDLEFVDDDSAFVFKCENCDCERDVCLRYHRCGMRHALKNMGIHTYSCPGNRQFLALDFYSKSTPFACILLGPFVIVQEQSKGVRGEITLSKLMAAREYISDFSRLYNASTYSTTFFDISMESAPSNTLNPQYDAYENYQIDTERLLERLVASKSTQEALRVAEVLLQDTFVLLDRDLHEMRIRAQELVAVISRAMLRDRKNLPGCFSKNNYLMKSIEGSTTIEEIIQIIRDCVSFYSTLSADYSNVKRPEIITEATGYIKQHYAEKITLLDVAEYCSISSSYLSKILREDLNSSFTEYTNMVRVEKSKELLQKNMRVMDIAAACGFEDQSYFTKVFKKATGMNPCRYREQFSTDSGR